MKSLTLDDLRDALPGLDELRPIFDHLLTRSEPDPARTWSGSGQLDTVGSRLVAPSLPDTELSAIVSREAARLGELYACVGRAVSALASGDKPGAARALLDAAELEEGRDRPERAEAYAAAAYRAAREGSDPRTAALALRRWARASWSLGGLDHALQRYKEAHEMALTLSDGRGAAEAAVGAGNVLEEQGRWTDAARWYETGLEAIPDAAEPAPERWHALLNLHIVARSRGAIEESRALLERAEAAAAQVNEGSAAAFLENAHGQLLMSEGAFAEAERPLRSALDATTSTRARVTIRLNLAEALLAQERGLDAAHHAREAEREAIRAGLVSKLPEVYRLLGRIASIDGNADAFVLFERALQIVRERSLPALEEARTLQAYAEAEARRGETEVARQLYDEARQGFAALGIDHMRNTWADVHAPGGPTTSLPQDE